MNHEKAKAMEGTEFDYVFENGEVVPAYVKKYDAKKGLTCLSLDTAEDLGMRWLPPYSLEKDGTFCVVGVNYGIENNLVHIPATAFYILNNIKLYGRVHSSDLTWRNRRVCAKPYIFKGCPF
jgi:hypothetical protein